VQVVGAVVLGVMGIVALAVAGEAIRAGRIWYRPKGRRGEREARWLRRSPEPLAYWVLTGMFGGLGLAFLGCGVWVLLRPR
jgi:hypothetical protein